jgi:hypothetical protein
MSVEVIRTFSDPFYTMSVALDGADYFLEWRYNQREDRWYFDVSLTDGTILVRGVKVVCSVPLLSRFADSRLPKGTLIALPNEGNNRAPGLNELGEGKRVTLHYVSRSELSSP